MSSTRTKNSTNRPWVEIYRPKELSSVSHQTEVVATLQNAVRTGNLPHLLFYGPPGSGKTSVALAMCRQLWDPTSTNGSSSNGISRSRVLELNASDERGISVVRNKIKQFASQKISTIRPSNSKKNGTVSSMFGAKKAASSKEEKTAMDITTDDVETTVTKKRVYPNPPFKIIILDEADTVTKDAQAALRRIIEAYSKSTRFILICNYVTRIIEPLSSRCAKFRFQSLPTPAIRTRLLYIADCENCCSNRRSDDEADQTRRQEYLVDAIVANCTDGDMRRAVTTLQSVHSLQQGTVTNMDTGDEQQQRGVVDTLVAEVVGVPPKNIVDDLWTVCQKKNTSSSNKSSPFEMMRLAVEDITTCGYSAQFLLHSLLEKLMTESTESTSSLSDFDKSNIAISIAKAEQCMLQGADEYLQLMTVTSTILSCS